MTGNQIESAPALDATSLDTTSKIVEAGSLVPSELTRGNEQLFLEKLIPLVRQTDLELEMDTVERIDAAGLSALIKLYCEATNSGHRFTVSGTRRHVREVLCLVGLDRILLDAEERLEPTLERSAA